MLADNEWFRQNGGGMPADSFMEICRIKRKNHKQKDINKNHNIN